MQQLLTVKSRSWIKRRSLRAFAFLALACALSPQSVASQGIPAAPPRPLIDPLFSDNMVLQRNQCDPIWGWTIPGTRLTVKIAGKTVAAVTNAQGKWMAKLPVLPVGGPYTLKVSAGGHQTITRSNVMVGDVWVCSGQSNMEFVIGGIPDSQMEIAAANYPNIRLMVVPHSIAISPQTTTDTSWQVCTPETLGGSEFSAVGYFFGRDLYNDQHVPIGLIESAFGGTNAEAWTGGKALRAKLPAFHDQLARLDAENIIGSANWQERQNSQEAEWYAQNDPGSATGLGWADPSLDASSWPTMSQPGYWEGKGIPTLANFDGVVWFRKAITLTADQAAKASTLSFKADDNDTTWVNGVQIGFTDSAWVQRAYHVPAGAFKAGQNLIVIRVLDIGGSGGIYGDPSTLHVSFDGGSDLSLAGEWQYKIGVDLNAASALPPTAIENDSNFSTVLYNGMIAPLIPYGIKGVLWYQGENNTIRPKQYRTLLPTLIGSWRSKWNEGDFPFLIVQLAGYRNSPDLNNLSWPELRDAQWHTAQTVPNTGIAMAVDIGDPANIHPTNKKEVGRRLALVALRQVYHEAVEDSGPVYRSMTIIGNRIQLTFSRTDGRLSTKDGTALRGFLICGSDRHWVDADAHIIGATVIVSSPQVSSPTAVRYSWSAAPDANLINSVGLPAFPFRTDSFAPTSVEVPIQ